MCHRAYDYIRLYLIAVHCGAVRLSTCMLHYCTDFLTTLTNSGGGERWQMNAPEGTPLAITWSSCMCRLWLSSPIMLHLHRFSDIHVGRSSLFQPSQSVVMLKPCRPSAHCRYVCLCAIIPPILEASLHFSVVYVDASVGIDQEGGEADTAGVTPVYFIFIPVLNLPRCLVHYFFSGVGSGGPVPSPMVESI